MDLIHNLERPPAFGDWVCSCEGCLIAAQAAVLHDPDVAVVIKFGQGPRRRVLLAEALARCGDEKPQQHRNWEDIFHEFSTVPGDYVREVFIAE